MKIHGKEITRAEIMLIASDGSRFQDVMEIRSFENGIIIDEQCFYLREKERKLENLAYYEREVRRLRSELEEK